MRPPLRTALTALALLPPVTLAATLMAGEAAAQGAPKVSAAQAEAKETARSQGNCTPNKVDVMSYTIGREGQTVFKITCTESKDAFVLVQCRSRICTLLR